MQRKRPSQPQQHPEGACLCSLLASMWADTLVLVITLQPDRLFYKNFPCNTWTQLFGFLQSSLHLEQDPSHRLVLWEFGTATQRVWICLEGSYHRQNPPSEAANLAHEMKARLPLLPKPWPGMLQARNASASTGHRWILPTEQQFSPLQYCGITK